MERKKAIEQILDHAAIEAWSNAFGKLSFNRYEGQALRGFLEEMDHLIDRRDDIDRLRSEFQASPATGNLQPDSAQQRRLYSLTKIYFDTYYGALSHLSSVVGRFSKVFGGVAHTDNKSFLVWLEKYHANLSRELNAGKIVFRELESARQFRALLNHPQQFSPPDWATEVRPTYNIVHIVMHGAQSRSGKIPPGSTRSKIPSVLNADWRMDAPDEVSVTNCLANASMPILSEILAQRGPAAAFVRVDTRQAEALKAVRTGGRRISPGANITKA
ncbi:hypothetical protein DM794_06445 [Paenarthrobacter ureafaciens]|uniref:hypothetical protein n=1 Tax=Paenarthrobacter ureafaciens TaxID=37931 RepID=UPI0015B89F0A|nr:hypothetical protein [Paenarthrobacter ureafaciens]NWL26702.1 hypothetical protein [Paenarthrobacter ureafaciens]